MINIMKVYYLLIGFVLFVVFGLCSRDVEEIVLRAHKLYEQQNIDQALELYGSIEKKGSATWYNMGNCYYKLGNYLDALICWRRAERDATWYELSVIHHNLDQVYKVLGIQLSNRFKTSLYRFAQRYLSFFSLYGWQLIFLLVWVLLLFLVAQLVRNHNYFILSVLCLITILFTGALYLKYEIDTTRYGIVIENDLIVYAGPDKEFHKLGSFARATEVTICEQQERWLKIQERGLIGWIFLEHVAII
ncbi:tetratricopeptide repeat protein [Candidatus Dependentiae bacterium]|nr:MAG: tetratricopeptide repeat protein [Candidatus Dependentiae bacterium]